MKEIKFRCFFYNGEDYKTGEMVSFSEAMRENYLDYDENTLKPTDECTILMQFTGVCNANGTEIYEGDIIKAFGVVCFLNGAFGCDTPRDGFTPLRELAETFGDGSPRYDLSVIGNIYENFDLFSKNVNKDTK
jgi:uncharacterized phage protein (TIGR01671 family)